MTTLFDRAYSEALTTLEKSPDFAIKEVNTEERKLVFDFTAGLRHLTFYVVCPSSDSDEENYHLWSDQEDVLTELQEIIDILTGQTMTMTDILQKIDKKLSQLGDSCDEEDEEDDDDDDDYDYNDIDYSEEELATLPPVRYEKEDESAFAQFSGSGSPIAVQRLLQDLKRMKQSEGKFGVFGSPVGNNLFEWDMKLTNFKENSRLGQDLINYARKYQKEAAVHLRMHFPDDYPMSPPFVRIVRPKFKFMTGHVTVGGSICSEFLTKSGWLPTTDIETILIQVRAAIMSDENARLDSNPDQEYTEADAKAAFDRMEKKYGWNKQ